MIYTEICDKHGINLTKPGASHALLPILRGHLLYFQDENILTLILRKYFIPLLRYQRPIHGIGQIFRQHITKEDVREAIVSLKVCNAPEYDVISNEHLKYANVLIIQCLQNLYNLNLHYMSMLPQC